MTCCNHWPLGPNRSTRRGFTFGVACILLGLAPAPGCRRESEPKEPPPAPPPNQAPEPEAQEDVLPARPDTGNPFEPPAQAGEAEAGRVPVATDSKVTVTVEPADVAIISPEAAESIFIGQGVIHVADGDEAPEETPDPPDWTAVQRRTPRQSMLQALEPALIAKWNEIHSLNSTFETSMQRVTEEYQITTEGQGFRDVLKRDGKILLHSIHVNLQKFEKEDEDPPTVWARERTEKVFDGEFTYVFSTTHKGHRAIKRRPAQGDFLAVGGQALIWMLRNVQHLKRSPDDSVDGRDVYVFYGTDSTGANVRYLIEKETGLLYSVHHEWQGAGRTAHTKFTEHRINPEFPDDHFTFVPIEGVTVEDLTQEPPPSPAPDAEP